MSITEVYKNLSRSPRLPHKRLAAALRLVLLSMIAVVLVVVLILEDHPLDLPEYSFILLAGINLLTEIYWLASPYLETIRPHRIHLDEEQLQLFTPTNFIYLHRRNLRLGMQSILIVSCLWVGIHLAKPQIPIQALLAPGYFIFSLIFLEWFTIDGIRHHALGQRWGWWLMISLFFGLAVGYFFYLMGEKQVPLAVLAGAFGTSLTIIIYLSKRVDVSEHVWSQVIGELIVQVLNSPSARHDLDHVVDQIANRLGYEHVSLLKTSMDGTSLIIEAEYGPLSSVKGRVFSIEEGINGRAFRSGKTCAWNDVRQCPYFKRLLDGNQDQTRAEIAIPIRHNGQTLGILDIQSRTAMVFGPGDIRSLEVIAQILGAAWAAAETDKLIEQGARLWDQLSGNIHSEDDVFGVFAEFAQKNLGADLVVYYRLSPTGFPFRAPQVFGNLNFNERMNSTVYNLDSPLYELIQRWKPYYEDQLENGGVFLHNASNDNPGFAVREGIKSAFFIPIGMPDEKMAVVFLNYRRKQVFDGLFQIMVLGFAQGFATTLAREWYRDIIFHGLARPELGVHNILGRYGMKDGVLQEGSKILQNLQQKDPPVVTQEYLQFLQDVDNCLIEIRAQTAKVSLNWESTLRERVDDMSRKIKEHVPASKTVRFIKKIDPLIERESPWTRLALYRVIEEAVNNAIFHGDTSEITILAERTEHRINLSIQNNGIPLPLDSAIRHSRSGIYEILDELKERFHAEVQINRLDHGTLVKVQIPTLPRIYKARKP
ncbi:MAG: GAF domain-containing protein [Chloroflexi bacterium]|nr:GAF domain-containing protein [Chloroflexota bacterium]